MSFNSSDLSILRSNYTELNNLVNERNQLAKSKRAGGHRINEIDVKLKELCAKCETLLQKGEVNTNDPSTHWISQLKDRVKSLQPKMPSSSSNELKQGLEHIRQRTLDMKRSPTESSEELEDENLPPPPIRPIKPS